MLTDIRKVRTFMAIVEEGSFTAAAARLNTAQPWVSNQLQALEDQIGVRLVERSKGKLASVTPQGEALYLICERLVAAFDEANAAIRGLTDAPRDRLVVGVDPITLYMPERNNLLGSFMANETDIDLRLLSRTPNELFAGLRSGELDLILTSAPFPDTDRFEMLRLYEYELCLLVPNSAQAGSYGTDSLRGVQIMVLQDSYHTGIFPWLRSALKDYDIKWRDCPELSFQALLRHATREGVATLVPDFSESMPEIREEMEVRPIADPKLRVCWGLMRRPEKLRSPAERLWSMAEAHVLAD